MKLYVLFLFTIIGTDALTLLITGYSSQNCQGEPVVRKTCRYVNDIGKCDSTLMQMWSWNGNALQLKGFGDPLCRHLNNVVTYTTGCVAFSGKLSNSLLTQFLNDYSCNTRSNLVVTEDILESGKKPTEVLNIILLIFSIVVVVGIAIVKCWKRTVLSLATKLLPLADNVISASIKQPILSKSTETIISG
jgi:hypothetical protein